MRLPTLAEMKSLYDLLQVKPKVTTEQQLCEAIIWSRLDPRLAEIVVGFLEKFFTQINPLKLRESLIANNAEPIACALSDFVTLKSKSWQRWKKSLQWDVSPAPFQSFYVNLYGIKPERMQLEIGKNLKPFARWGFFCNEAPQSDKKSARLYKTQLGPTERKRVLSDLLVDKTEITVNEYLQALNGYVHRRQAERDLQSAKELRASGYTRGRVYRKVRRN
jgi:hypothetical protein